MNLISREIILVDCHELLGIFLLCPLHDIQRAIVYRIYIDGKITDLHHGAADIYGQMVALDDEIAL